MSFGDSAGDLTAFEHTLSTCVFQRSGRPAGRVAWGRKF